MRVRTVLFAGLVALLIVADASARPAQRRHPRPPIRSATLRLTATAYCDHGTTKSGVHTREGIVAADPRRLPLGTRLRIVAPGKSYARTYTVADTGSGIKGRDLDIFMASCERAKRFGRRIVQVRILRQLEQK
jgi:3D (Asp-Asp-Asp) domain-containing protein